MKNVGSHKKCLHKAFQMSHVFLEKGAGRMWQRSRVSYVTLASNWYWLTVGARSAILVAGKGRGGVFLFILFLHFLSFSSLSLSFISSTISFLSFSGRRHKMTYKGWCVVKPQHNQLILGEIRIISTLYTFHLKNLSYIELYNFVWLWHCVVNHRYWAPFPCSQTALSMVLLLFSQDKSNFLSACYISNSGSSVLVLWKATRKYLRIRSQQEDEH